MMISPIQGPSQQTSMKRRVYDVIGVLAAADIITKTGTTITWVGYSNNMRVQQTKVNDLTKTLLVKDKIEKLKYKLRYLSYINALIVRNRSIPRPQVYIQLPFIVFQANFSIKQSKDQLILKLANRSDKPPHIITQFDIASSIDYKFDLDNALISNFPSVKPAYELINAYDDENGDEAF